MGRREVKDSCVCGGNSVSRMEMLGAVTLTGVPEGHWPYGERWDKGLGENEGKPATGAKMGRKGSENKQSKTQRHMVVKVKVREGEVRLQRSGARTCITEGAEAILPRCLAAVGGGAAGRVSRSSRSGVAGPGGLRQECCRRGGAPAWDWSERWGQEQGGGGPQGGGTGPRNSHDRPEAGGCGAGDIGRERPRLMGPPHQQAWSPGGRARVRMAAGGGGDRHVGSAVPA